jgi:hypothetical protein
MLVAASSNRFDWTAVAAITSAVIALIALGFSVVSFQRQTKAANEVAHANVKPLLYIHRLRYKDHKALILRNHGLGPATIVEAAFSRTAEKTTHNIVKLFDLRHPDRPQARIVWQTFDSVEPHRVIPRGGEIVLVRQSASHLMRVNKISEPQALGLLCQWQEQRKGIHVHISYTDVLGQDMEPLDFTFD